MSTEDCSNPRNLPKAFALAGILLGCLVLLVYWLDFKLNLFNLPTAGSSPSKNHSTPWAYEIFHELIFILCPGQLLHLFTIGLGDTVSWLVWCLGALLNGPIYYVVGLLVSNIRASMRSRA